MSYQLLHVLSHGCSLHKERGLLVMHPGDGSKEKRSSIEDIRAVVIAARGVSFSSDLLSALCSNDAVILHCNEKYCPCGITAPLAHTTRTELLQRQCCIDSGIHRKLWEKVVGDKVGNQSRVLQAFRFGDPIPCMTKTGLPDESAAARYYWPHFFAGLGCAEKGRCQDGDDPVNAMLNYGYAVLTALVHRAIVTHGLLPEIGIHHKPAFNSYPLVYDLMEPLRPFVDALLIQFLQDRIPDDSAFPQWCRHIAQSLLQVSVAMPEGRLKLLYALDEYAAIVARCMEDNSIKAYWSLKFEKQPVQNGLDHDHV